MRARPYTVVDVFTDRTGLGNPVAVVHGAGDIDADAMQAIARWTQLSETTFLLPPTDPAADYRVRIWTPVRELPFAGHPTLGTARAWLAQGGVPRDAAAIVQQCGVGPVRIRVDRAAGRLAFAAPPLERAPVDEATRDAALAAVGVARERCLDAQWLRNGPRWLALRLDSAEAVLAARPDAPKLAAFDEVGLVGAHAPGNEAAFELRGFVGGAAPFEDPVTGSLNAGVAEWLMATGVAPARYVAAQGTALGRRGRVEVERRDGTLWIGGGTCVAISGSIDL